MEDIYQWCRDGNSLQVRGWLDDISHNMNEGDDHGFSPLHWAAKEGHLFIVQMLINKGAKVNVTNMGDDAALHLAVAHGHKECVQFILKHKPDINAQNEHGNTPLHYACFWNYQLIAELLLNNGASVNLSNKYNETPLEKCKGDLKSKLLELAQNLNQDVETKIAYKDKNWFCTKIRSKDATLSRHSGIPLNDLDLHEKIASTPSGDTWKGVWQNIDIVAKFINLGDNPKQDVIRRATRSFTDEYPKLRIFSHSNILPVIGCTNDSPNLIVVSQYFELGTFYHVLHEQYKITIDYNLGLKLILDVVKGMEFLHTLDLNIIENLYLNSKHIYIDCDLVAKINMADIKFSFQDKNKLFYPAWMSPESLQKKYSEINKKASDMWSFAILLWEVVTLQVPFAEYSPMEAGMKIALEDLRLTISHDVSTHIARLIRICMNEEPGKRPTFEQIIPILQKIIQAK